MANVSYKLKDLEKRTIKIGYVGENDHMHVLIDCKEVFDEYPAAVPTMAIVPPEGEDYPKAVNRNGNIVEWLVKNSDVAAEGDGEFQLTFTEDNVVKKSVTGRFSVERSISGSGTAPSGIDDWLTDANEKLAAVEEATQDAEDAAEHQPKINSSGYWEIWDAETGAYVATTVKAQGDKGDPGDPGSPGDPTQLIDDTAGQGTTGKTWSADKLDEEFGSVLNAIQGITETHVSKNLYNKTACNPADGKAYWDGSRNTASSYATTGKIPVEAETQYVFSAGSVNIQYCEFFSGETGGTFISRTTLNNAPFTTPENCTFVAVMLFNASHTTEEYEKALAVAQLNKGVIVQPYEPYGEWPIVPYEVVEDGEKLKGISSATVIQPHINLYDKALAMDGKFLYENQITTVAKNATTGLIPVKPNTQYCFSKDTSSPLSIVAKVWEFNSERSYIGYLQSELGLYNKGYSISFKTSANTRFIGINLELNSHTTQNYKDTIDTLMLTYGTHRPLVYSAYSEETVVLAEKISNSFFTNPDCFVGKRWLALGTSVTWYDAKKYQSGLHNGEVCRGYVGNVARRKQISVNNNGIAGSTLGNVDTDSLINRYQSISWTDYDVVTLEYGINDYGNDIPVGTDSDAAGTTTFAACLRTVIEYAMSQNKKLNIVVCTEPDVRGSTQNNNNNTLKDYTDVTLAIAAKYRLPVCDWFYHSGINNWNRGDATKDWLTADGTHPNDEGHMRMGAMLNQVFDSLYC